MLKRAFIGILCLLAAGVVVAQAYKWVDENGVVHYSDRPQQGAERITLPQDTVPRRAAPAPARAATQRQPADDAPEPAAEGYESLSISSPGPEETLWNLEGVLNVSLSLQPSLRQGHQVRVYFDGEPRMVSGPSFQIADVYRGVHNIQAEVVDATGKLMIRSTTTRFYVQQTSVANRPR